MSKPHKHAAVIKAWADGAQIQYRVPGFDWKDCDSEPGWALFHEYRVKPEPKQVWARCYHTDNGMNIDPTELITIIDSLEKRSEDKTLPKYASDYLAALIIKLLNQINY